MQYISESDFQRTVTEYADACGWRWTHFRPAKTEKGWRTALQGSRGYPDLVLVRAGRLIHAELKSQKGKPDTDQQAWLDDLADAPGEVYLWQPADWPAIEEILR